MATLPVSDSSIDLRAVTVRPTWGAQEHRRWDRLVEQHHYLAFHGVIGKGLRHAYRYTGSLTTPPCSEGVSWFVIRDSVTVSPAQIAAFKEIISSNNRPVMPLFGRQVGATVAPSH